MLLNKNNKMEIFNKNSHPKIISMILINKIRLHLICNKHIKDY